MEDERNESRSMTGSTERAADAERLAEIDDKLAKERKLGGWLLSHNDGEFLRRLLDTALRDADELRAEVGRAQDIALKALEDAT